MSYPFLEPQNHLLSDECLHSAEFEQLACLVLDARMDTSHIKSGLLSLITPQYLTNLQVSLSVKGDHTSCGCNGVHRIGVQVFFFGVFFMYINCFTCSSSSVESSHNPM